MSVTYEETAVMPRAGNRVVQERVETVPFRFTGKAGEWFGIWIVNILLSILTLGIYSAWAKVRRNRYFYGNTFLDGHNFEYHAKPTTILKGRIAALVVIVALNAAANLLPPVFALAVFAIYLLILPWALVRGFSFNANMSSHRNVRFGFHGTKRHALMAYIVWPLLIFAGLFAPFFAGAIIYSQQFGDPEHQVVLLLPALAVLALAIALFPIAARSAARFRGKHSYGVARFHLDPPLKAYWGALGKTVLVLLAVIGALLVFSLLFGGLAAATVSQLGPNTGEEPPVWAILLSLPFVTALYAMFLSIPLFYAAWVRNIEFDNLMLDAEGDAKHRFTSNFTGFGYAWVVLSNLFVSIITLGLMVPWAQIRLARYKAEHTAAIPAGDLDGFVNAQVDKTGVASGEFLDLDAGFDVGF